MIDRRVRPTSRGGTSALLAMLLAATVWAGPAARSAVAQIGERRTPSAAYYSALGPFYDGDYPDALRAFESESRSSIKSAQSRWIDSICYQTMCGECYVQMGAFDAALPHFTDALRLFVSFSDWMTKVQFPPAIRLAGVGMRKAVPWGVSSRQAQLGFYPASMLIGQGQVDFTNVIQQGGIVQQANLFPVTPQEIVRATTLAMRRRATLLGPLSKFDPLTNDVLAAVNRSLGPSNHWSESWANLERGLAFAAGGKPDQATSYLQRAVLAGGEFDHPLTSIALLELGRLAFVRGQYPAAAKFFEEATYAAVNYPDSGVLEEAFRYGMLTHLLSNRKGLFAPLEPAIQWAKVNRLRQLRASLLLCAAENYAVLGESGRAAAMLDEARATIARRPMGAGWIGARLNYLNALVAFQQRRTTEGNTALAAAMGYMRHGSLWLFHIALADQSYAGGAATSRVTTDVFNEVLRDPQPADWTTDPMESLAVLVTPQMHALEHWFEAAIDRNETQTAMEIAERIRRRRFFGSLELGGRLESLRWVLEASPEYLPQSAQLQRQELLTHFPAYDRLSQQARKIRATLARLPLVAEASTSKEQSRALSELAVASRQQEAMLREMALRREPASSLFPPLRSIAEVQRSLPNKHAILAFFATSRRLYGFLLNNERFTLWPIGSMPALVKQMQAMLREMGQYQPNHELALKEISDAGWKQSAKLMLEMLLKGSPADFTQPFEELVVVPDGALWYLPFEALQVTVEGHSQPLIARFRLRYAPTLSLTTWRGAGRNPTGNTAVVLGKLFPRDEDAVARHAFDEFAAVVPGAVALRSPPPAPSAIYRSLFQRLVVLDDLVVSEQDPYGFAPAPLDHGKGAGSLSDWLALPWGGPDVIILPGFHTAAEDALKRPRKGPPGNEVFLSVCGLMANGARTLLLSRWRTGGQTSFDLVREFTQELPRTSAADAWQRAILVTAGSRVNLDGEPRIKRATADDPPKANHPFFWAGYMLIDCGTAMEPKPDEPVIKEKQPAPKQPAEEDKPKAPRKRSAPRR
jgi:CHAT domain-containing protein